MTKARARKTRRVWLPAFFFGLFTLAIAARLVQIQALEHEHYAAAANNELTSINTIYARRGSILDRNGSVLATSVDTWDIYVNTRTWKDPARAQKQSALLGKALRLDPAKLRATVAESQQIDVLIARDVDYAVGRELLGQALEGVALLPNTARVNPEGDTGASVVGFIGQENTGLAGIEAAFNDILMGRPGRAVYERDTTGEPIPYGRFVTSQPEAGKDVVLTIDRYLQQLAEARLDAAIKEHRAKGGAIIMMDPTTGEILALATQPGLKYSQLPLTDARQIALLKNAAVSDMYEPGSVMKAVTAAAAIDRGVVTPDTSYVDNGVVLIYDIPLKNWQDNVYGPQTMTGVLQNSINTGAVFMEQKLGDVVFQQYLDAFGFGKPTGIDLAGEAGGIVRRVTDKDYSPVDAATQSFGQSISVTPLQMIAAVAATVNGGNLVRPHVVKATVDASGKRVEVKPEVTGHPIRPETSATIRGMLDAVVNPQGNTHPGQPKDYRAGGKSGTANVPVGSTYNDTQIASFMGVAPIDDPKLIILVKLDENQDFLTGTAAAAPIFAKLADDTLHYLNVVPTDAKKRVGR